MIEDIKTVTETVGVKDGLVKETLSVVYENCKGEVDFLAHITLMYEVACELVGLEDEEGFRDQMSDSVERILESLGFNEE